MVSYSNVNYPESKRKTDKALLNTPKKPEFSESSIIINKDIYEYSINRQTRCSTIDSSNFIRPKPNAKFQKYSFPEKRYRPKD